MTGRKDFVAIAKILNEESDPMRNPSQDNDEGQTDINGLQMAENIARRMAHYFAGENPRFDRTRFLKACGLPV